MGSSKSKVRKLNPKTLKELQKNVDVDFTKEEIENWYREYQTSLKQGKNQLTMNEFKEVYNSVFEGDATSFVEHLFRSFDSNHDGFVDFKEFLVGLCVSGSDNLEKKLKWAFRMYDIDGNGSISRAEMTGMLQAIYKMVNRDLSNSATEMGNIEQLVSEFFQSADHNHDNAISSDEFVSGVQTMPVMLQLLECDPNTGDLDPDQVTDFASLEETEAELSTLTVAGASDVNNRGSVYKAD